MTQRDTADGEQHEVTLDHEGVDVTAFYSQFAVPATLGVEASGYSLTAGGHRLRLGPKLGYPRAENQNLHLGKDLDTGACVIDVPSV